MLVCLKSWGSFRALSKSKYVWVDRFLTKKLLNIIYLRNSTWLRRPPKRFKAWRSLLENSLVAGPYFKVILTTKSASFTQVNFFRLWTAEAVAFLYVCGFLSLGGTAVGRHFQPGLHYTTKLPIFRHTSKAEFLRHHFDKICWLNVQAFRKNAY